MSKPNIYLKLADGRILPDCQAGITESSVWLFLKNMTMQEAAAIAFDKDAIRDIEFHFGSLYNRYEGYSEVSILMNRKMQIEVSLTGGQMTKENEPDERDMAGDGSDDVSDGPGGEA